MKILIVEDEPKIAKALKRGFEQESYAAEIASDGDTAIMEIENEDFDLVVLDRMIPGELDGMGILGKMRKDNNQTPVILLTAKDTIADKVAGLNLGADDYLVKPFVFDELIARARALLRRPQSTLNSVLEYKDVSLDSTNFVVKRGGKTIELSKKEFALLEYFMRNPGKIISKDSMIQHVWNYDADILPNTVEVFIRNIRSKLEKPFKAKPLIATVRGFGYRFGDS